MIHFYTVFFLLPKISKYGVVFTTECPLFERGRSAQTVHSSPKLMRKRHIFGMSTSLQNDSCNPKLCCLSCTLSYTGSLVTSNPPKYCFRGQFLGLAKPLFRNSKTSWGIHSNTPIHACFFRHGQNRCRISVQKAALYW